MYGTDRTNTKAVTWQPGQCNEMKDGKRLENRNIAGCWWLTLLFLELGRQRTLCEFETSLVYKS